MNRLKATIVLSLLAATAVAQETDHHETQHTIECEARVASPQVQAARRVMAGGPLSLQTCRDMALGYNKTLASKRVQREMAAQMRKSARTKYLPSLDVMGGAIFSSREISILNNTQKSTLTNIGTSHIEFLGSREGICRAKPEILEGLRQGGAAVLFGDEPLLWDKRDSLGCTVYTYGMENQACDLVAHLHPDGSFTVINNGLPSEMLPVGGSFTAKLSIPGAHNVLNALAAASVGLLMGETVENIRTGLVSYTASGMRQNIYEQNGFRIYADCYNASPDAMEATLGVLGTMGDTGRRIAVLGSMLELGDYTEEGHRRAGRAAAEHADVLYAYGPSADAIARGAEEKGMTAVHAFTDQNELVEKLRADAKPGDALLFKGSRGMRMERALALFLGEEVE